MKAEAVRRRHEVHLFRDAGTGFWTVASGGRSLSRHRRQKTAVRAATRVAKRRRVDLVIHALNGRIRSKDSYGNESVRHDTEH